MALASDDLDAIQKSVNETAGQVRVAWITYLTLWTYLVIIVGSVTHRMLLLEGPVKLPMLNLDLPLVGFFVVAPLFFVVVHFYALLQISALARRTKLYVDALGRQFGNADDRFKMRQRLDASVFVQFFTLDAGERSGIMGLISRAAILLTMIVIPIVLLLQIQAMFLPYHHADVTWLHRVLVLLDLGLIWIFWPALQGGDIGPKLRNLFDQLRSTAGAVRVGVGALLSGLVLVFSLAVIAYPTPWFPERVRRLVPDALVLANEVLVEDSKSDRPMRALSLRGRDLRDALLINADLRRADFSGSDLSGAKLDGAKLSEARFGCMDRGRSVESGTLFGTREDTPPPLNRSLDSCTWLAGASLVGADLQGAKFDDARLLGASLIQAQAAGASFIRAVLPGALFFGAMLEGTSFENAILVGAHLHSANLQGAVLNAALLDGASLFQARLRGASLVETSVFRTVQRPVSLELANVFELRHDAAPFAESNFQDWRDSYLALVPAGARTSLRQRLEPLDPGTKETRSFTPRAVWEAPNNTERGSTAHAEQFRDFIMEIACRTETGPHVARGLIWTGRIRDAGPRFSLLAKQMRDDKACPGAKGLTNSDLAELDRHERELRSISLGSR
jgi:uncharacterized protein YjbI with pentapeptide repeats